ncbi:hypothetical protein [Bacillus thuringiensis]|uniref:hypothetical protein n=1 Tax=Bacillus thuringiensis TaxID=1428 RepID=UPI00164256F2|nr:hypothetical protein [Bacillus thuringiensis]
MRFGSYGVPYEAQPNASECKKVLIYAQIKVKYAPENERCILVTDYPTRWYDRDCN